MRDIREQLKTPTYPNKFSVFCNQLQNVVIDTSIA